MKKAIFFDWKDYDQFVTDKFKLDFTGCDFSHYAFNLEKALGYESVSIFVDSKINEEELKKLKKSGCKRILLRSAGYDIMNVAEAKSLGLDVYRVASYSPESIAEFVFALILSLARKIVVQHELHEDMQTKRSMDSMGFLLQGRTLGLHGYGKIARAVAKIAKDGFGMQIKFFDPFVKAEPGKVETLEELYSSSDIVSIHVPLMPETKHSVNRKLLNLVKPTFMLINTARGEIVDSEDIVDLIAAKRIDYFATDVWKKNDNFDPELLNQNVIQTDHIAFFTEEAVKSILEQTLASMEEKALPENRL